MILRSIELEHFGKFRNRTFDFRRGMNLVVGPNEAGKSTLAEAVPAVLFGTDRLEKFKPWGRNACAATLSFEGGGRTIQVKRNLITDDVELVERDDLYHTRSQFSGKAPLRGRSSACCDYRDLLESLLGVADEKLFRATYFFGHHPQEWNGDDLAQSLRTLVSGTAEADYAEILDSLLDEHFSLTRSNPWGRDKQRDREYEDVCRQLDKSGPTETVPVFVEIDNSNELKAKIDELSARLVTDRLEYEKGLRYVERVRRRQSTPPAADPEPAGVIEPAPSRSSGGQDLVAQLTAAGLPGNPPRELPGLLAEAAEIRQEMSELQQPYALLNNREKKIPDVPWIALLSVSAVLAVVVGVAWWQKLYLLWVAMSCGSIVTAVCGWCGWRFMQKKNALAKCEQERNRLDQKKMAVQHRQSDLSERCEAIGLPSSPIDMVRLQKLVSANRDLLEKIWAQDGQAPPDDVVTDADTPEPVPQAADEESGRALDEDDDLEELEARLTEFKSQLTQKEEALQGLQLQLDRVSANHAFVAGASGAALQTRKAELESRIRLLRKAINLLAGAVDEFGRSHLLSLNEEAGRLFGKITAGKYAAVKLDENMSPSVQVDGRRWMLAEHFSKGTIDALYLALRIALAKVRDDGRSLPLMLDDPFVHLDQKRLNMALNMVDMVSAEGQLVLFSHNLELGKRAARERWHVVPLDGDTAAISGQEGGEHVGQLHLL